MGLANARRSHNRANLVQLRSDDDDGMHEEGVVRLVPSGRTGGMGHEQGREERGGAVESRSRQGQTVAPFFSEVRPAQTEQEREAVFRFRYQVYVEELGKRSRDADHTRKVLFDDLDARAILLFVQDEDGKVIATIRTNIMSPSEVPPHLKMVFSMHRFEAFEGCVVSISSRGMVSKDWRGTPLMGRLVIHLYHVMKQYGVHFDFCHCRPSLVHHYEAFGARRYADNFVDPDAGYQVPLVSVLNDVGYYKRVNPMLYGLSRRYENDQRSVQWFYENLGEKVSQFVSKYVSEDGYRRFLEQTRLEREVPLFHGLSARQVARFLEASTILHCKPGDLVVRQGEPSGELYVLLSGFAEVRREGSAGTRVLATLSQGDVFGEMGVVRRRPRSATVEALSEARVLVLSPVFFERIMRPMPEVTARVLFNLSRTLCERLDHTTRNWIGAGQSAGAA